MSWKTRWAVALACLLLAGPASGAGTKTVQDLINDCRSGVNYEQAYCLGFIAGSVMLHNGDSVAVTLWAACSADEPTFGAMRQAFLNWADKHPEDWNIGALAGVALAIKATWPCPPR
jgi:hypothetical protein